MATGGFIWFEHLLWAVLIFSFASIHFSDKMNFVEFSSVHWLRQSWPSYQGLSSSRALPTWVEFWHLITVMADDSHLIDKLQVPSGRTLSEQQWLQSWHYSLPRWSSTRVARITKSRMESTEVCIFYLEIFNSIARAGLGGTISTKNRFNHDQIKQIEMVKSLIETMNNFFVSLQYGMGSTNNSWRSTGGDNRRL